MQIQDYPYRQLTREAVVLAGGATKVAGTIGSTRQAVHYWYTHLRRGVPPTHVNVLARLSGIPRERLRPDVYGECVE